ncbi:MAG: Na/Pi cotransporter family protein [Rhodospirillales bacterium]|nr:Na/Pi cotransporter family protein [Rhodospirillales bacterium]
MEATWTLLDVAGWVALLLWGVHMVQTGIQRGFGPELRHFLGTTLHNRFAAFAAGLGVTAVLQSSTATGLMVAGFAAAGAVALQPALAVMLGANVGTTLIVQAFSFDVSGVAPVLFLLGVLLFRRGTAARTRDLGRVSIGLGLMLFSLHSLILLLEPFEDMPNFRMVLGAVATQPVLDVLLAAGLTWAAHSSVAVVLLTMSFAAKGAIPPHAAFALVLGANLGTAINPVLEGVAGDDPVARRLPIGNLLTRVVGVIVALIGLEWLGPWLTELEPDPVRAVADFHTAFNLVIAVAFLPILAPYAKLLERLLPPRVEPDDPSKPRYLDPAAIESPPVALAGAAREALRMADGMETMLNEAAEALSGTDRHRFAAVRRGDDVLDRLCAAVKTYLTQLDPEALTDLDSRRLNQILAFATNLEAAGDVIDRNVMAVFSRRLKRGLALPEAERAEAAQLLARLARTARMAGSVLMTEDARAARMLASEKETFRELEASASADHLNRLRAGGAEAEASLMHLELLRELKRVNGHLVAAAAYPVLEEQGELLPTRLRLDSE